MFLFPLGLSQEDLYFSPRIAHKFAHICRISSSDSTQTENLNEKRLCSEWWSSSVGLKSRWCICLSIPKVENTLNIHVSHALVNCFYDAEDKVHHLWQSVQFPNPGGLFYFLHMAVWSHSRLDESWSGTFHGAMTLGGGCNHLEMSWERSTPTSQPSSTSWLMRF